MAHHQPLDMSRIALKCGRRAEQHVGAIDIDIPIVEIEECCRAAKGDRPVEIYARGRRFDNDILGRRSRIRSGDCGLPIRPFAFSVACDRSNSEIIPVCASSTCCCCQKRRISKRKRNKSSTPSEKPIKKSNDNKKENVRIFGHGPMRIPSIRANICRREMQWRVRVTPIDAIFGIICVRAKY